MITKVRGLKKEAMMRYGITDDDFYIRQDQFGEVVILNRRGIDKVIKKVCAIVRIDSIQTVPYGSGVCTTVVMTGRSGELTEQRVASANPDNCKYPNYAEVAEKRCKHRIILSLADLYEHGIFSDVESDEWVETRNKYEGAMADVEKSLSQRKSLKV